MHDLRITVLLVATLPACVHQLPRETDYPGSGAGIIEVRREVNPTVPVAIGTVTVPMPAGPRNFQYQIRAADGTLHIIRSDVDFEVSACVAFSGYADGPSRTHWSLGRATLERSTGCQYAANPSSDTRTDNVSMSGKVPIPPVRIHQQGYSFVPLNEPGWVVLARTTYQVALAKPGTKPDETFAIQATLLRLPAYSTPEEFIRIVEDGQKKDIDPLRFTILKHEVRALAGRATDCTNSHAVAEDNAAVTRTGRSGIMVLEMLTITCAHPRSKGVGVNVAYSHRHYPGDEDPNFVQKATQIIESVQFTGM